MKNPEPLAEVPSGASSGTRHSHGSTGVSPSPSTESALCMNRTPARESEPPGEPKENLQCQTSTTERTSTCGALISILVADDDARHRKLLTDVLQAAGYAVIAVENGAEAIEQARSAKPSLILMDIEMPVLDGLSAVKILKSDPETRSIHVLAITALAMRDDRARMLEAGFDGYMSKPIDIKELRAEVKRHLRGVQEASTRQ